MIIILSVSQHEPHPDTGIWSITYVRRRQLMSQTSQVSNSSQVNLSSLDTWLSNLHALFFFCLCRGLAWACQVTPHWCQALAALWRETQCIGHVRRNVPNQAQLPAPCGNSWVAPWADDGHLIAAFSPLSQHWSGILKGLNHLYISPSFQTFF